MHIAVFVLGDPKGQPRPRAFARGGKARVYDPATAEGWKSQIALAIKPLLPPQPLTVPAVVEMEFVFRRPKAHFSSTGALKLHAPQRYTSKPDVDNLAKAVLDALSTVGLWRDDDQVTGLSARKRYAEPGEAPGMGLWVTVAA
jgi:Holliday junction resolvase RusA-like endonuclease